MSGNDGDGMGEYASTTRGGRGVDVDDDQRLREVVAGIAKANGTATLVSQATFDATMSRIASRFGSTSRESKEELKLVLTYYFGVHGTSPETEWAAYPYPIVHQGVSLPPINVVNDIGLHLLKKFMGRQTLLAIKMVQNSPEFRNALSERAARAGLGAGQEHMAIDFVGKDGTLSKAEAGLRLASREKSLAYRAHNANSIATVRENVRQASAKTDDVRSASAARPLLSFDS